MVAKVTLCAVVLILQELISVSSQSINVTFTNATDIIYLTTMNDNKQYHEWFDMVTCSVINYNSNYNESEKEYYWLSIAGVLNGDVNSDTIEIMSDIYDININHNNNPNLPFIITDAEIFQAGTPILGASTISNNIIQCYVYHINNAYDNVTIDCILFNQTTNTFTDPITVSNIFAANPEDPFGKEMFWGFDVICFDDDTFFIAYIESHCLFYTLLYSNGTIITFNKLLFNFNANTQNENQVLFLIKSNFNINNMNGFINSFLLYYTDVGNALGIWEGIYYENYSLKLNNYKPLLEMQSDERFYGQKPILLKLSNNCCYILPYSYGQWNEIDYMVINCTGQRVVSNDYQIFTTNNMYQLQYLIPLQYENNNYFLSFMPSSHPSDEYLHLYAYIFSLNETENKNDPNNQYQLNVIGKQIFVNQLYNDSNTNDHQIYGLCAVLSNDNKHLFLSWISQSAYGNPNRFDSIIYAQTWNISWYS